MRSIPIFEGLFCGDLCQEALCIRSGGSLWKARFPGFDTVRKRHTGRRQPTDSRLLAICSGLEVYVQNVPVGTLKPNVPVGTLKRFGDLMSDISDRELGMKRNVTRRDFLNGVAVTAGAAMMPWHLFAAGDNDPEKSPGYYPPALTGLRGSHPGAFD